MSPSYIIDDSFFKSAALFKLHKRAKTFETSGQDDDAEKMSF